jgi:hypothetical protein
VTDLLHELVLAIETRVAERFRADASSTMTVARWAVLSEAPPIERDAFLAVLLLTYELQHHADDAPQGDEPAGQQQ